MKKLGILGGMGPYASLKFTEEVLNLTNASKDWEHIHIVLDSNVEIPSRTRNYLYNELSPIPGMIDSIKKLNNYPVDVIAIPCNSACYFLDYIDQKDKKNVLNIIEVTSNRINEMIPKNSKIGVLGGYITYKAQTYKKYLKGYSYIEHTEEEQQEVSNFIELIKLNKNPKKEIVEFINRYKIKYKVDVIVLGCTEFLCIDLNDIKNVVIIDSSRELAREIVKICKGD